MTVISRRAALAAVPAAAAFPAPARARARPAGAFTHGVASGDPLARSVILWTRYLTVDAAPATLEWEVAEDEGFTRIAARGEVRVGPRSDFCAKADVRGLRPGRRYAYRFLGAAGPSVTGLTRTAPEGETAHMHLGLFSCSNLPFGYFPAYGHAARRDEIDLCVHVGDYIYEYPRGRYPNPEEVVPGRVIEPEGEIIRLTDYHQRYASYRADPDLQEVHRVKPFAVIWDDHELANDAWRYGAQEHDPAAEGLWIDRRAAATKAYFDWMPIRPPARDPLRTYRALAWGRLATLILLDTRLIGRDRQLDIEGALIGAMDKSDDGFVAAIEAYKPIWNDPNRSILGDAQERWARGAIEASARQGATWQVLAQQLVMGARLTGPAMLAQLPAGSPPQALARQQFRARMGRYGLSPWGDGWGGYPAARARLLSDCASLANNALVLGGDTHNAWACTLPGGEGGRAAALEIGCAGVSSPGLERTFREATPEARAAAMREASPEVAWCDLTHRGYATLKLTKTMAEAEWVAFDSVRTRDAAVKEVTRAVTPASARGGMEPWAFG